MHEDKEPNISWKVWEILQHIICPLFHGQTCSWFICFMCCIKWWMLSQHCWLKKLQWVRRVFGLYFMYCIIGALAPWLISCSRVAFGNGVSSILPATGSQLLLPLQLKFNPTLWILFGSCCCCHKNSTMYINFLSSSHFASAIGYRRL